jgi:hypothetical protein
MGLPVASGSATAGTGAGLRRALATVPVLAAAVTWSRCAAVDRRRPGAISAIGEIAEARPRCPAARRPSALVGTTAGDAGDAVDPRTALEGIPRVRPLATSAAIGTHTATEGGTRPGPNEIVSPPNEIVSHPLAAAIACVGHPRRVAQPRRRRPALIATPRLPWTRPPRFSSPDPRSTSCAASAPTAPGRARARTWTAHSKPCAKARGAIVRVGVGGGRYQVGELAGGAQAPLADADTDQGPTHPVLRLIDERDQVVERAHSLGVISNSAPTRAEWGAYVDACRNGGMPPPRVGDVEAVKAALDRVFLVGEQVGFGSAPFSAGAARGVGRSPPRDIRRNVSPPREFGRAPREMPRDGPNGGGPRRTTFALAAAERPGTHPCGCPRRRLSPQRQRRLGTGTRRPRR